MNQQRNKRRATRAEKTAASALGARLTPNSGAGTEKGDSRVRSTFSIENGVITQHGEGMRIESKCTEKETYSFNIATWDKIEKAALRAGETPVLHLRIGRMRDDFVLIAEKLAAALGCPRLDLSAESPKSCSLALSMFVRTTGESGHPHVSIQVQGKGFAMLRLNDFAQRWQEVMA